MLYLLWRTPTVSRTEVAIFDFLSFFSSEDYSSIPLVETCCEVCHQEERCICSKCKCCLSLNGLYFFCITVGGVATLVSVSEAKIQITLLILRRGALSTAHQLNNHISPPNSARRLPTLHNEGPQNQLCGLREAFTWPLSSFLELLCLLILLR